MNHQSSPLRYDSSGLGPLLFAIIVVLVSEKETIENVLSNLLMIYLEIYHSVVSGFEYGLHLNSLTIR